jgi:hypothetical protein
MFVTRKIESVTEGLTMARIFSVLILAAAMALNPATGAAFDASQVRINGFASQTYIESDGNNFLVEDSEEGSLQLNEVGITFNAPVSDNLRIGAQLLSRDFGSEGNNEVDLDWGFGDYRHRDWLGIRIGKVKVPNGLYNEGRDSDFLRDTALLPQSIYPEERRAFGVAVNGVGLYGNFSMGTAGDLDYDVVVGEVNVKDDAKMISDQVPLMNRVFGMLAAFAGTTTVPAERLEVDSDGVVTARLVYNTPINGLRAGYSYQQSEATLSAIAYGFEVGTIEFEQSDTQTLSLEYLTSVFSLRTEYRTYNQVSKIQGSGLTNENDTDPEGGYFTATYHIPGPSRLSLSATYDFGYADKDDHEGQDQISQGNPDFAGWRKDTGIALRYDVTDNFILKAEYHDVNGVYGLSKVDNEAGFEEDWSYSLVKASFVF